MNQLLDVLKNQKDIVYTYESLQDQIIYRDLCFVIDENKTFEVILDAINEIADVKNIEVFDLYE
jgi:phenylalanyl-tRNA synthetase beta subunit